MTLGLEGYFPFWIFLTTTFITCRSLQRERSLRSLHKDRFDSLDISTTFERATKILIKVETSDG